MKLFNHVCYILVMASLVTGSVMGVQPATSVRAASTIYTVNSTADPGDGACDVTDCTLREALNAANALSGADTIMFSIDGSITLSSTLPAISDDVTISGMGHTITVSGASLYRVMVVNSGKTLNLNTLTIANGNCGPGMCNGGGLHNNGGTLNVTDTTFSSNSASDGGGIYNSGTLTVTNGIFNGNSAVVGGGIYNTGTLSMTNSTFSGNSAGWRGGGILNDGPLTVANSSFSGNSATTDGGGIHNWSPLTVTNSTFSGNSAITGGGINNWGTLTMTNGTFSGNSAATGGGIYVGAGSATLQNTIVANSTGGDCSGTLTANGFNLDSDGTCDSATQKTSAEINLGALSDNGGPTKTMALLTGSAAIDVGDGGVCPATDQRIYLRPQDGNGDGLTGCDLGAFELGSNTVANPGMDSTLIYTDTQGSPTTIVLAAGAVTTATTVVYNPVGAVTPPFGFSFADHAFELDAYQGGVLIPDFTFQQPVTITLEYSDTDLTGVDEAGLTLMYWDGDTWLDAATTCLPPSTYSRDPANNRVSLLICHLSLYALIGPTVEFKLYLPLVLR